MECLKWVIAFLSTRLKINFFFNKTLEREEAEEKARKEKEEKEREYRERIARMDELERKRREREKEIEEKENLSRSKPETDRDGPTRPVDRDRDGDQWGPPRRDMKDERGEPHVARLLALFSQEPS